MHCAISPTRDKSPFNLLVYKPPTSARNILKIVELGFSQFCLLCALVRLWVELICIRRTKIFQPMMARTPETYPSSTSQDNFLRFGNHQQRKDIPMAEFILETSYPSETNHPSQTDNSSKYKFGTKTNYGAKFVSGWSVCQHVFKTC